MKIGRIDFPQELIAAQKNNNLVVFAGAGISMPAPSELPDFEELAKEISQNILDMEANEPLDRFLGRLQKDKNYAVHEHIHKILSKPGSKPNSLHENLLSLFPSCESVRIVTTNQDPHFTTLAKTKYDDQIEIYYSPALPLGHSFHGIVHLHGSVLKAPEDMIFTDKDFGRAYITEAWAAKFLLGLFNPSNVILFIGYSHTDPLMKYLARGLAPDSCSRYALTEQKEINHWKFLDIKPIVYPDDQHPICSHALSAWIRIIKSDFSSKEQRISKIVSNSPLQFTAEDSDFIKSIISDPSLARYFRENARGLEWLKWVDEKGGFDKIFGKKEGINDADEQLIEWLREYYLSDYSSEVLALIKRNGNKISPILWRAITHKLAYNKTEFIPDVFSKWVTVLLQHHNKCWNANYLNDILNKCKWPDDKTSLLLLFQHLTSPHLKITRPFKIGFFLEGEETEPDDCEIYYFGEEYYIKECWDKKIKPNLSACHRDIIRIISNIFEDAYFLLSGYGKTSEDYDPLSSDRAAIEPHEQNLDLGLLNLLVDMASDTIGWMLINAPEEAARTISTWEISETLLLRRLAIHAVIENPVISDDGKMQWLLAKNILFSRPLKHEICRLIKKTYEKLSNEVKNTLIAKIDEGPEYEVENKAATIYNLLDWLLKIDPACEKLKSKISELGKTGLELKSRGYPDLNSWSLMRSKTSGHIIQISSPVTEEELENKDPAEEIDWLLKYNGDPIEGPDRYGLLTDIVKLTRKNFAWSWKLAQKLEEIKEWQTDLWSALLEGWKDGCLTEHDWSKVLNLLINNHELFNFQDEIALLLQYGIKKGAYEIPFNSLVLAENLFYELWEAFKSAAEKDKKKAMDVEDWLNVAINHPCGRLIEFRLYALSRKYKEFKGRRKGLSETDITMLNGILVGKSYADGIGRIMLISRINLLFTLDPEWTKENIIPFLDWQIDEKRARQAWHGFIIRGTVKEGYLNDLMPYYRQAFSRIGKESKRLQRDFCHHIASITIHSSINPLENNWINAFLIDVPEKVRVEFARSICRNIPSEEHAVQNLWQRWLSAYLSDRIRGIPVQLSEGEKEAIIRWIIPLKDIFPDISGKIYEMTPGPKNTYFGTLYEDLEKSVFAATYTQDMAKLLKYLLSNASIITFRFAGNSVENMVEELIKNKANTDDLYQICDSLHRLNCPRAQELKQLLDVKYTNGDNKST